MENPKKGGAFGRFTHAGIRPACPKCGHDGFIALRNDAVINADKDVVMIACNNRDCYAVVGVLPVSAVWDD